MWTYMTNHYEGRANEVIKAHRKRQLYNKLQTAKCRENSDLVTHINYMFELREELEGLGAKVEDTLMIDFLLDSLPTHERFERIKGMIDMGFEAVNMAEKEQTEIKNKIRSAIVKIMQGPIDVYIASSLAIHLDIASANVARQQNTKEKKTAGALGVMWFFDTGANTHVANNRKLFLELSTDVNDEVHGTQLAGIGGTLSEVKGVGTVSIESIVDGETAQVVFDNVLYVPNSKLNLISVEMAVKQGYKVKLQDRKLELRNRMGEKLAVAVEADGLYPLINLKPNSKSPAHRGKIAGFASK
ncbi:hypothetical protein LEN26_015917, partial [Aphanomyces euteiches]